jgi:hypothetical protein
LFFSDEVRGIVSQPAGGGHDDEFPDDAAPRRGTVCGARYDKFA